MGKWKISEDINDGFHYRFVSKFGNMMSSSNINLDHRSFETVPSYFFMITLKKKFIH